MTPANISVDTWRGSFGHIFILCAMCEFSFYNIMVMSMVPILNPLDSILN